MTDDLNEVLSEYMNQEKLYRLEGRTGFENLCKIVEALGYRDNQYFGQLNNGACVGSLIDFFEDNSGALQAVVDWISEQHVDEWQESLESYLPEKENEN